MYLVEFSLSPLNGEVLIEKFPPQNISNNEIISIAQDNSGTFWLGSESSGVYWWDPSLELIENYRYQKNILNSLSGNSIWAIEGQHYNPQKIWVGNSNGLNSIDLEKQTE